MSLTMSDGKFMARLATSCCELYAHMYLYVKIRGLRMCETIDLQTMHSCEVMRETIDLQTMHNCGLMRLYHQHLNDVPCYIAAGFT